MTMREPTERELNNFVRQGVICNLSHLVSVLVNGASNVEDNRELADLCERAQELSMPIPDYEEAAREAGWQYDSERDEWVDDEDDSVADDASEACQESGIDPLDDGYMHEPFEFWAVDNRMAELLDDVDEKVERDFAGHNVWARTTTGQAISMDSCIRAAWLKLQRDIGEITGE